MLHNTLQTNATQMTPEARGTAVAIFSSALYLGQTLGVAAAALVVDRFSAVPVFLFTAVALPALGWWFACELRATSEWRLANSEGRSYSLRAIRLSASARDALDLGAHQPLDQARQIVVEPGLEHRPQHLAHQIFERAGVLHQHRLRQRVEGGIDRRAGGGDIRPWSSRSSRSEAWRRCVAPSWTVARDGGGGSGSGGGLSSNTTSELRRRWSGSPEPARRRHRARSDRECRRPARRRRAALPETACSCASIGVDLGLLVRGILGRRRRRRGARRRLPDAAVAAAWKPRRQRCRPRRRRRRARLGACSGLGGVVVGNDSADGGENLLHRGLLRLRWLSHLPRPRSNAARPSIRANAKSA